MIARLAHESLADVPTCCLRCGALLREDTEFTREALRYTMPQRRYVCHGGHSVYTGLVEPVLRVAPAPGGRGRSATVEKCCVRCAEPFQGATQQKYCGEVCVRAADVERSRSRDRVVRQRLTGAALKQARALPTFRPRSAQPDLVAYAPRPTNLSKAWV